MGKLLKRQKQAAKLNIYWEYCSRVIKLAVGLSQYVKDEGMG